MASIFSSPVAFNFTTNKDFYFRKRRWCVVFCSVAGLVQILSGTSDISYYKSYFDDPKDQEAIMKGISWYEQGL